MSIELKDIAIIAGITGTICGGFWAIIKFFANREHGASSNSKVTMWTRIDELRESTQELKLEQVRLQGEIGKLPSFADIDKSIDRLERHIDKKIDTLDNHIEALVEIVKKSYGDKK